MWTIFPWIALKEHFFNLLIFFSTLSNASTFESLSCSSFTKASCAGSPSLSVLIYSSYSVIKLVPMYTKHCGSSLWQQAFSINSWYVRVANNCDGLMSSMKVWILSIRMVQRYWQRRRTWRHSNSHRLGHMINRGDLVHNSFKMRRCTWRWSRCSVTCEWRLTNMIWVVRSARGWRCTGRCRHLGHGWHSGRGCNWWPGRCRHLGHGWHSDKGCNWWPGRCRHLGHGWYSGRGCNWWPGTGTVSVTQDDTGWAKVMELDDETMSTDWTMDGADEAGDVFCWVALDFDEWHK